MNKVIDNRATVMASGLGIVMIIMFPAVILGDGVNGTDVNGFCTNLIQPFGYHCSEHITQTKDGYLLGLQRVSSAVHVEGKNSSPVLLIHGLFAAGDCWFLNSLNQSLGFILADHGFDVWVGNIRGVRWSHGHASLSHIDKAFWDWSWQDLALFDFPAMIRYVNRVTNSKVIVVGHSQGTIMSFAGLTQPNTIKMVRAAALLTPISYMGHVTSLLVRAAVDLHIDEVLMNLGIGELNIRSEIVNELLKKACANIDCKDLVTAFTGKNCCFNKSTWLDTLIKYGPHPTSAKNLNHWAQSTFAKYDYGVWGNLRNYGTFSPPNFEISRIPKALPIWIGSGGNDGLADATDVQHTLKVLKNKPSVLYLENYGHLDFIASATAKEDVYDNLVTFFQSLKY